MFRVAAQNAGLFTLPVFTQQVIYRPLPEPAPRE
jgi:hypothetical protein